MHGSVFTRAKDKSSSRGLKSLRFCLVSIEDNQATTAKRNIFSAKSLCRGRRRTVRDALQQLVGSSLESAYRLIVKNNHLTSDGNRRASQRKQGSIDVLLPEMTDEVNRSYDSQWLQAWLHFGVSRLQTHLSTVFIMSKK
jgi:hypothetical protein